MRIFAKNDLKLMTHFHTLTVKSIQRITPKSVNVSFDIPEALRKTFQFKAGQYLTIKKSFNGTEVRRSYSICSTPESGKLTIGIKKLENGLFSQYANNDLREGETIEVHEPEGRFIYLPSSGSRTILAFAAGSGITPIMSIMQTILEEDKDSKFILVYGNKSVTETMFYDTIQQLKTNYPDRLLVQYIFSKSEEDGALFGRIERSTVNFLLKNRFKDENIEEYYLCGPEEMINTVSQTLLENGISKEQIHFELFTSSINPVTSNEVFEGQTQITVTVDDEEVSFVMSQSQTVLEAVLKQNIDAPYSCQGGICSSCIARVKEGEVTMVKNQILTDGEVAEGLILTCQSHPTSTKVVIDYDDV